MFKKAGMSRTAGILFVIVLAAGCMLPSSALAYGGEIVAGYGGSVAAKLFTFFPNASTNGLKDFSTGLGVGVDARADLGNYFALAGEFDYIGLSTASQVYDVYDAYGNYLYSTTETVYYTDVALKLDALVTLPLYRVTPFFGAGLVYNTPTLVYSSDNSSISGSGIGMELVGGADLMLPGKSAITVELSIPVSQIANFDIGGVSQNVDVGGVEIMVGYRLLF